MELWENELLCSITTLSELKKTLELTQDELGAFENLHMPFRVTPHILHEIIHNDYGGKIRMQYIPHVDSCKDFLNFRDDYLDETSNEVCKNLVKRYPNKAILLATNMCAAYCRFCTRKRTVNDITRKNELSEAFDYLSKNPNIYDVIITGGDPLILNDTELENIFWNLRKINSVEIIRINTRIPVTLPSRISDCLIELLKKYNINYMNIHFEHPNELTQKTIDACLKLANNGILLGSQSVLLKNINNDCMTLKKLFKRLLLAKVRPYYLYECDKITGCQQFYVNPSEGILLINQILEELPGLCVPRFVIDAPGKMGKITVSPNGLVKAENNSLLLKNYHSNEEFLYK
ncbi:KamA family radical SAM protein [Lachnospiraceae bacterium 62-26]|jgi:KamA family protein